VAHEGGARHQSRATIPGRNGTIGLPAATAEPDGPTDVRLDKENALIAEVTGQPAQRLAGP
jgi:hypothetical protein